MISTVTPRDCGRMTKRALQFQAKHVAANYEYLTSGCGRASTVPMAVVACQKTVCIQNQYMPRSMPAECVFSSTTSTDDYTCSSYAHELHKSQLPLHPGLMKPELIFVLATISPPPRIPS